MRQSCDRENQRVTNLKGIQLFLKMGKSTPKLVPYSMMIALNSVEVNDNMDEQEDGFQLHFTLGKRQTKDYTLAQNSLFEPDTRVVIGVRINNMPWVLISGVITHIQLAPSNQPALSTFSVTGRSITHQLNRTEKNDTYERLSDTDIVRKIVNNYARYGLTLKAPESTEQPLETELIPHQATTDMAYIQALAQRNGYVFYSQPVKNGDCLIYWGPENRTKVTLPVLSMNMGALTNVTELSFAQDSDIPNKVQGVYLDPQNKQSYPITVEALEEAALATTPTPSLNTKLLRDVAKYTASRSTRSARAAMVGGLNAVTGQGVLDAAIYPHVLEAGKVVEVRGAGFLYDGKYVVTYVKHLIERSNYTQKFRLAREGVGTSEQKVQDL
jgi:phage protein D